ncbi:hypothetical protein VTL71DRAFT_14794 [Oculimacula yallundae]|uniref:Uncharacterized protein n=1 Tax=Oculimacula yallundae TaxID=86028 RepID=A0ABR4CLS1_9HELO
MYDHFMMLFSAASIFPGVLLSRYCFGFNDIAVTGAGPIPIHNTCSACRVEWMIAGILAMEAGSTVFKPSGVSY